MPRPSPTTPEQDREMVRLYAEESWTRNRLALAFGAARNTVTDRLRAHGVIVKSSPETCRAKLRHDAFVDAENDPDAAYWVGFLMADGCVSEQRYAPHVIISIGDRDRSHAAAFLAFVGSANAVYDVPPQRERQTFRAGAMCRVDVASKQLAADLARYGVVPRKTRTAEVRGLELNAHFWRGVVDGDGSIHLQARRRPSGGGYKPRPVIQICGSVRLMWQFAEFAATTTGATARPHRDKTISAVSLTCGPALEMLSLLYDDCPVGLARKVAIARSILAAGRRRYLPSPITKSASPATLR